MFVSLQVSHLPSHRTLEIHERHPDNLVLIFHQYLYLLLTNPQFTIRSLISGLPMLDITMFFFLVFHFLPFVLASPCFTRSQTAVFAHRDLLSIPGLSIEAMSPITPAIPRQPSLALATEATIVLVECAAKATAGHGLSIATQDPSPFYHDHQSSWRSEDITDVLLAGIMALAALLALAIKYLFIPLGARGQQPGRSPAITQGLDFY